jgi:hypothetical protein
VKVLVANFHVKDELDHSPFMRCGAESDEWLDRDGVHPPVKCTRAADHQRRGSDLHRAIRYVGNPALPHDIYWTDTT